MANNLKYTREDAGIRRQMDNGLSKQVIFVLKVEFPPKEPILFLLKLLCHVTASDPQMCR